VTLRWPWLVGLALASALAVTGLGLLAGAMSPADVPSQTATVSVTPGETLSDLAARFAPESDPGAVVARIKALNGLADDTLVPGLPLAIPAGPGGAAVPDAG
jgi:LysM repeat protein